MDNTEDYRLDDKKIAYLQLLQGPIGRMSSTSAIYKGFSAAILAGLASASFTNVSIWALLIGVIPILSFFCLDVYYLSIERKIRFRYHMVAEDHAEINFRISLNLTKEERKLAKSNPFICILSPSIWLFYLPMIGCTAVLLILKINGCI